MIRSVFTFIRHTIPGKTYHIQLMLMKTKTRGIMLRQTGSIASQLNLTTLGDRQLHCKVEPPQCFIQTPKHRAGNEHGVDCPMRPKGTKIEAEGRQRGFLGREQQAPSSPAEFG